MRVHMMNKAARSASRASYPPRVATRANGFMPGSRRHRHRRSTCGPSLMALSPLESFFDLSPSHLLETEDFMGLERARPMAVDFIEDENSFQIKADIPGVAKEDIQLDIDHNVVTISATRTRTKSTKADSSEATASEGSASEAEDDKMEKVKEGDEDNRLNIHRFERYDSFVSRSFRMPKTADLNTMSAKYEDGVLTVDVQKTADDKIGRRTIDIE